MNRYETIVSLGDEFIKLMGKSLIPIHVLDWKVYYEAYLKETELLLKQYGKPKKEEAVMTVAANYDIARRTMYNVIAFMEAA